MVEPIVGVGFAGLASLGLAVQSLAVRVGTREHTVSTVVAVIFAVNLLVFVPLSAVLAYPDYGLTPPSVVAFAIAGLLGSLVARFAYFVGIARLGASRTEPLKALFPVVAVGMAVVVLGEVPSAGHLAGIVLVLGGGIGVVLEARDSPTTPTGRRLWLDLCFPLGAAVLLGIDPIFTKLGLAAGTPAVVGVTVRIAAGAVGFACYLVWRRLRTGGFPSVGFDRWLVVASLANTVYLLAYYAALVRTPVAVVTPVLGTSTLLVVAGAAAFLQSEERVTRRLIAAAVVVMVGVGLVVQG